MSYKPNVAHRAGRTKSGGKRERFGMGKPMTTARAWPNNAKEARDRSAEKAAAVLKLTERIIQTSHDADVLRWAGQIGVEASSILRLLEHEGACTRPE